MELILAKGRRTVATIVLVLILLGLALTGMLAAQANAGTPVKASPKYSPDQFLVKFKPGTPAETKRSINAKKGVKENGLIPRIVRLCENPTFAYLTSE